jgi:hypothetical protein
MAELKAPNPDRAPTTVAHLTGEEGGVWHVHTIGSLHIFDFDAGKVGACLAPGQRSSTFQGHLRFSKSSTAQSGPEGKRQSSPIAPDSATLLTQAPRSATLRASKVTHEPGRGTQR